MSEHFSAVSMHVALHHVTQYLYDRKVRLGPQLIRLRPAAHYRGQVFRYSMTIEPDDHLLQWTQDDFGNRIAKVIFPDTTERLRVSVELVVERQALNPFDFFLAPGAVQVPVVYALAQRQSLAPYLHTEIPGPLLQEYLSSVDRRGAETIDFLVTLNQRVQRDIRYRVRREPGVQSPDETLEKTSGSCRDSSWLLIHLLRHCGFAARFVSGYLLPLASELTSNRGQPDSTVDPTELHAWCEVFLPGAGWIGLDPTSGLVTDDAHVPLACAPHPAAAAPIEGSVDPCEVHFSHQISLSSMQSGFIRNP